MLDKESPVTLDESELALLAAYRSDSAMPSKAKARLVSRLEAPKRVGAAGRSASSPGVNPWVWVGVLAAAAVVAVVVGRGMQSDEARQASQRDGSQAAMPVEQKPVSLPSARPSRSVRSHEESSAGNELPVVEPPREPELNPQEPTQPRSRRQRAVTGTPPSEVGTAVEPPRASSDAGTTPAPDPIPSTVEAERRLLAAAWRALAAGQTAAASSSADEHARRFPKGVLAIERDAIAAIAACKGNSPSAGAAAKAFLATHGKTPLAGRVRAACGFEEKKLPSTDG